MSEASTVDEAGVVPEVLVVGLETLATRGGGLNRYVDGYLAALREAGVAVELAAASASPAEVDRWLGPPASSLLRRSLAARRAIAASPAATIDLHFAPHAIAAALSGTLRRRHVVVHFHGPFAAELAAAGAASWKVAIARRLERSVYRRASRAITLSQAFADELCSTYGVDPARVAVIAPGVELERFTPGQPAPHEGLRVVAVRRLQRRMGLEVAVEAMGLLRERGVAATLELVGAGPQREALEVEVANRGLGDVVSFAGFVPDGELAQRYRDADVSVVPTVALEGFGLIVLESLACGTPVVASEVGGLAEVVGDLDRSLLVAPGDAVALADRLEAAARGGLPSRERCRSYAEAFTWAASVQRQLAWMETGPRRLKVRLLGHHAKLSGGELAMARQLPAITGASVEVELGAPGPLVERLEAAGIAVQVVALPGGLGEVTREEANAIPGVSELLGTARYVLGLAWRLRRDAVDVLHTNTLKAALLGGVAGRLAMVPVVWHLRDRITPEYLGARSARLVRLLGRVLPSYVVANSASTAATLRGDRHASMVIASPVDPGIAAVDRSGRQGPLRIGMVGRLAAWKGQDLFLRAFADVLAGSEHEAVLVGSALFGEDAFAATLEPLAEELGIAGQVDLRGFREDVGAELERLDVLVHASVLPEPFGQVIVEGMASGLAVIASRAGGAAEIVTDGVDGLLTEPGDQAQLAAAIARLVDDASLRARLGAGGLATAARYTPARLAPRYLTAWSAAVGD